MINKNKYQYIYLFKSTKINKKINHIKFIIKNQSIYTFINLFSFIINHAETNNDFALYINSMFCLQFTSSDLNNLLFSSILFKLRLNVITYFNNEICDIYSIGLIFWNCLNMYGVNVFILMFSYCFYY